MVIFSPPQPPSLLSCLSFTTDCSPRLSAATPTHEIPLDLDACTSATRNNPLLYQLPFQLFSSSAAALVIQSRSDSLPVSDHTR